MKIATMIINELLQNHHKNKSFWANLFALYLLDASIMGRKQIIPTFHYVERNKRWIIKKANTFLNIPTNIDRQNILVESNISKLLNINIKMPRAIQKFKPDIIINAEGNLSIIRVTTVGNKLEDLKKRAHIELTDFLNNNYMNTNLFFLISLRHVDKSNFKIINHEADERHSFKIILWEHIFKDLYENFNESFIYRCSIDV